MKNPADVLQKQEAFFNAHETLGINFRIQQLRRFKAAIQHYEGEVISALKKDLGKGEFEAFSSEIGLVQHELTLHIKNLKKWATPKRAKTPLHAFPSRSYIYRQPFGKVLVISPFNYPFMLALTPVAGSVAAGNVVVLKPSEFTPNVALVIQKIIEKAFDEKHVAVIQGGVEISQQLLSFRWDKIFFTGSTRVGKIVLDAAAKHITPVVLELGGKNPVIVDKDANLKIAAKRIIWGKLLNAGQSCVAPDYLYVHADVKETFLKFLVESIKQFYSEHPHENGDYTRIVNKAAVQRLSKLVENTTVYYGGNFTEQSNFFAPTVLTDVSPNSPVMQEEIFGPVLPVLTFQKIDEVIEVIKKGEKPLAAFYFSENKGKQQDFLKNTYSGDAMINDVVIHFTNISLPFGGVGYSGMGSYHGKRSFEVFSHERSVMKTPTWIDLPLRYPPYKTWILKLLRILFR